MVVSCSVVVVAVLEFLEGGLQEAKASGVMHHCSQKRHVMEWLGDEQVLDWFGLGIPSPVQKPERSPSMQDSQYAIYQQKFSSLGLSFNLQRLSIALLSEVRVTYRSIELSLASGSPTDVAPDSAASNSAGRPLGGSCRG